MGGAVPQDGLAPPVAGSRSHWNGWVLAAPQARAPQPQVPMMGACRQCPAPPETMASLGGLHGHTLIRCHSQPGLSQVLHDKATPLVAVRSGGTGSFVQRWAPLCQEQGAPLVGLCPGEWLRCCSKQMEIKKLGPGLGATSPEVSWSRIGCRLSLIIMMTSLGWDSGAGSILVREGSMFHTASPRLVQIIN